MDAQADNGDAVTPDASPPVEVPVGTEVPGDVASTPIPSTRVSKAWVRLLPALVLLAVILVFVVQNPRDVKVHLFSYTGTLPLAVSLLSAAALGAVTVLVLGSVRIIQLRRLVRRRPGKHDDDRP